MVGELTLETCGRFVWHQIQIRGLNWEGVAFLEKETLNRYPSWRIEWEVILSFCILKNKNLEVDSMRR